MRIVAKSVTAALACCFSAGLGAQETCGLSFIPGPAGQFKDLSIDVGDPPGGPLALLSADLSGTGRPDIILGIGSVPPYEQSLPLRIVRPNNSGDGMVDVTRMLLGPGPLPSMEHPREIVVADFNRDGRNDVFFAAHGYDAAPYAGERNVLLLSTAGGTYSDQSQQLPQLEDYTHSTTVGDVNGDGYLDIFAGNFPSTGETPYMLLGGPAGVFTATNAGLPSEILIPGFDAFLSSLLVDLDGDRFPDLVLGKAGDTPKNMVLWNDGTGSFKVRPRTLLPDAPFGVDGNTDDIVALDVNDDGLQDLAITTTQMGALQDVGFGLQLLVNQGNGIFTDESQARLGAAANRTNGRWWTYLRAADVNRDGWDDLYAVGAADAVLPVPIFWINRGDGTFCAADNFTFFADYAIMETTDVDGDGRLDWVNAYQNPDTLTLEYRTYLNRTPAALRSISVGDVAVTEGHAGTTQASFPISLSQAAAGDIQFDIYTDSGTAAPGVDYASGAAIAVKVPAGQTSVDFPVTIVGDTEVEANETFTLNLANVRHAAVAKAQGLGRITNDDLASLAIADASVTEGDGGQVTLAFTVSLSRPMPSPVTFDIATSGGSAGSGTDFVARNLPGRLLDAGRTRWRFEVQVLGDANVETDETFQVNITNVAGAALSDGVATGTIVNDDVATLRAKRAAGRKPSR